MAPEEIQETIYSVMEVLVNELRQYEFEHDCIAAGALLTKTLHHLGLPETYRLTVGVQLVNHTFDRYVKAHGFPDDEVSWKACREAGGDAVNLGRDAPEIPEGNWPGHLVVIVPSAFGEKHALLDPTISQVNHPGGVSVPPLTLKVKNDFVTGTRDAMFDIYDNVLCYKAYPEDVSYNEHGDSMENDGFDEAVEAFIRRLKS